MPANAGDTGDAAVVPGLGRCPGEGNGNPLQYSCLENPKDRGDWWPTVSGGHKELDMTEQLSTINYTLNNIIYLSYIMLILSRHKKKSKIWSATLVSIDILMSQNI